jgi:hypothetical protein
MAKLKAGEYRAVSIAGLGERVEARKSAKVSKGSLYTNEVDGHQHKICVYDDGSMYVEYATMGGADCAHSHNIVFEGGQLTILADSGHTHELAEGQPGLVIVPQDTIVVQASARSFPGVTDEKVARAIAAREQLAAKSTRGNKMPHGGSTSTEKSQMPDQNETKIAELEKQLARLSKIAKLSGAQKSHFDTLNADDAEGFLAKSNADRDALVADIAKRNEETNKIVYTSKSTGDVYRANDDARLIEMAKRMDAQADEIEKADIRKAAAETLGKLAGGNDVHDLIIRSVKKSGASAEKIGEALTAMKGWNALAASAGVAKGENPGADPQPNQDLFAALEKGLKKFAKDNDITKNVWTEGLAKFAKTDEGAALKRAYDEARKAG